MTTTAEPLVEPSTIPVADLEPMLADRERECDLLRPASEVPCGKPAAWLLGADAADCGHFRGPVLACHRCKEDVLAGEMLLVCPTLGCVLACYVRWIEPL